jgi:TonB family protein
MKYAALLTLLMADASVVSLGEPSIEQAYVLDSGVQCDARQRHDKPPLLLNRDEALREFDAISVHLQETNQPGGLVVVGVALSATGAIEQLEICQRSGYETVDRFALDLVAKLRFAPAQDDGEAVPSSFTLPVRLAPADLQEPRPPSREFIEIPEIIDEGTDSSP